MSYRVYSLLKENKKENPKATPAYYIPYEVEDEPYPCVGVSKETSLSAKEASDLFIYWYNKIKFALEAGNKHKVYEILLDWEEECIPKADLQSLVYNYFEKRYL
jgi:hypothetical protein